MDVTSRNSVAVITGGGNGIGRAISERLAQDGFSIAVIDLDQEAATRVASAINDSGGHAAAWGADVANAEDIGAIVTEIASTLGTPSVLVNNAGVIRDNLLFRMSTEDWDIVANVHLRGAFVMTKMVHTHMVNAGYGRIINISSTSALGNRGQANYAAAKAGVQGFTKTLALELGPFGITANAIAPGFIATDMTKATAKRLGVPFEEFESAQAAQIAVRRSGQPADVATAASFFASAETSFISGQVLYVAGGPHG